MACKFENDVGECDMSDILDRITLDSNTDLEQELTDFLKCVPTSFDDSKEIKKADR